MGKTPIGDEVEERIEYFEDWLKNNSDDEQRSKVVNDKTARDFIREVFMEDASLRNLVGGMDDQPGAYDKLVDGKYLQKLMLNNAAEKLGAAVVRLREKEESLAKALRKSKPATQRTAIRQVMSKDIAKKYGYNRTTTKKGVVQYRDAKSGRYVSSKALLDITEKVILASKKEREGLEKLLQRDYLGRPK